MSSRLPGETARPGTADGDGAVVEVLHGRRVADPFRWLEDPDSPATAAWLAERDREFAAAARSWPLRVRLAEDIRALVRADLWSPPERRGDTVFATLRAAGAEHPRLLARTPDGQRTVFDPAAFDPSGRTTLDAWEPSPDGRLVAVQTSRDGTERGALRVLDARTGLPVEEPLHGLRYTHVAWLPGPGAPAFYYVRRDGHGGRRGVWLHRVHGPGPHVDVLVHACAAPRTVPGVRLRHGRWLLITESHGTGHRNDVWIADLAGRSAERPPLLPVHVGLEAESEADVGPDGTLYLRTTLDAPRRRLCATTPAAPSPSNWREVLPEDPETTLDGFAVTGRAGSAAGVRVLAVRTRLGISELTAHDPRDGRVLQRLPLPGEGMATRLEPSADGGAHLCYADVATQQVVLVLRPGGTSLVPWPESGAAVPPDPGGLPAQSPGTAPAPAPGGVRPAAGIARRVLWCRSADGTRVPVTVLSPAGPGGRPGPTILHGYGGFGRPRQFGFSATVLAWLRAGGRYAVAHVRGGGDAGREWHLRGARRAKIRAVQDLLAAADQLVAAGVCGRDQLCLSGGSAGGLLVLAAAALRPDVGAAVIASAPLADMVRFERLGLGAMWTREFGTVADPGDFAALLSYSPYHLALAAADRPRPAVLLTGFHGDTRTDAAHPRKMCAALLAAGPGQRPVLLRYERGVGHGPRAVTRAIDLAADAHAFAAAETGLSPRR
ncbi:S9 family peptidase [Marinitenerispora sediminis]|uniref:prolyl oligopeptidase n=1 Tax=Marinitenerispora sediminis TaxID=1931232 RepID=A0A368T2D9_9ACTN|nr:S9 family peptidase [Marinitenerispora sediminis]RCV55522.1 S9 family peptidase [Marinitenerispora sediminis]RCV57826.1 S9 family peptidase [Marinitenerispora sediminis]